MKCGCRLRQKGRATEAMWGRGLYYGNHARGLFRRVRIIISASRVGDSTVEFVRGPYSLA